MEVPFTMQLIIYSCRLMTENLTDQQGAENVRSFVTPNLVSSPGTLHSPKAGVSKKKKSQPKPLSTKATVEVVTMISTDAEKTHFWRSASFQLCNGSTPKLPTLLKTSVQETRCAPLINIFFPESIPLVEKVDRHHLEPF